MMKTDHIKEGDRVPTCNCLPNFTASHLVYKNDEGTCPFCKYYVETITVYKKDINKFKRQEPTYYINAKAYLNGERNINGFEEDVDGTEIKRPRRG